MDKRGRDANKRHRDKSGEIKYKTVSLTIVKPVVDKLNKAVKKTEDNNMSKFIEENVIPKNITKNEEKRKYEGNKIKKTFTFSEDFTKEIKKSGNMSLYIETELKNIFSI